MNYLCLMPPSEYAGVIARELYIMVDNKFHSSNRLDKDALSSKIDVPENSSVTLNLFELDAQGRRTMPVIQNFVPNGETYVGDLVLQPEI